MKKFWEKHSLGKSLAIVLGLSLLLTWIVPTGSFNGTEFVKGQLVRLGLADLGNMLYYVIAIAIDKILFLLVLGIFYGILTKVPAYQKLVNKIAMKMKGKEILFASILSFVLALFASLASNVYATLVFVPFIINVLTAMKLDKVSITAVSFGSILVGVLGCMFGTEGLSAFNQYLATGTSTNFISEGWTVRMIVFIVVFGLFTFFNILHMRKALKDKKAEAMEDPFVFNSESGKETVKEVTKTVHETSGLMTAAKVFMVISCVAYGWTIIPLIWLVPMTKKLFRSADEGKEVSTGFKICTLIFASFIGGILLLCDQHPYTGKTKKVTKKVVKDSDGVATWPLVVVLVLVALLTVIGFINWNDNFGVEVFVKFHDWLVGLTISDNAIISYILGSSAAALGTANFSLFTLISVLLVFSLVFLFMGGFSFEDTLNSVKEGTRKMGKVILPLAAAYTVFAIFYLSPMMNTFVSGLMKVDGRPNINIDYKGSGVAYFNIDTDEDGKADKNLVNTGNTCQINCDTNNDGYPDKNLDFDGNGKVDENDEIIASTFDGESTLNLDTDGDGAPDINVDTTLSIPGTILTGLVSSIFHTDFNYTAYSLSSYFVAGFASNLSLVFIILITMFGFSALFVPTSALLIVALSYTDLEYSKWLKYIWRFLACTFAFLIILYIVLLV